jgi:flagellar basal body-associated protein FliL
MTTPPSSPAPASGISMELLVIFGLLGLATLLAMAMAIGFWWMLSRKSHDKSKSATAPAESTRTAGVTAVYSRDEQKNAPTAGP